MEKTLAEIAKIIDGEVVGDKQLIIKGLNGIREAKEGDITFVANSKYFSLAKVSHASAIITPKDMECPEKSIVRTENPSLAFARLISAMAPDNEPVLTGIHKSALIGENVILGKNVAVGPYVIIEDEAAIGENSVICGGSFIGRQTTLGKNCLIYPNVTIRERLSIGSDVIVHSGTVIGSDGYGFIQIDGNHIKIPQTGTVVIEDDVEIGANVTIDRARFDTTFIGRGTKIDNLVQIAHNVHIGAHCLLVSQSGVSGSSELKENVTIAGQVGVAGHLTVGEGAVVAAKAGVTHSIPPFTQVSGFPAKEHTKAKRVNASLQRLPQYVKKIRELEKRIEDLESKQNG